MNKFLILYLLAILLILPILLSSHVGAQGACPIMPFADCSPHSGSCDDFASCNMANKNQLWHFSGGYWYQVCDGSTDPCAPDTCHWECCGGTWDITDCNDYSSCGGTYPNDGSGESSSKYYDYKCCDDWVVSCCQQPGVCADSDSSDGVPNIDGSVRTCGAECDQDSDCASGVCLSDCTCGTECNPADPCCDNNGVFRPSTYVCDDHYATDYRCSGTACGADAQVRYKTRKCTGTDADCIGTISSWSSWQTLDDCSYTEKCVDGTPSYCQDDASCIYIPDGAVRVFVTSTKYTGNLGGLSGADAKCQARADAAGLGGNWVAWLSNETINAKDRIADTTIGYYTLDGTKIANDKADLTDGNIIYYLNILEDVTDSFGTTAVWTGTKSSGLWNGNSCNNWASSSSSDSGGAGSVGEKNYGWTEEWSSRSCDSISRLYCFEILPEICTDGIDNDLDGLFDCEDPDCDPACNSPPNAPTNPSPYNGETGLYKSPTLSVYASDPDGDDMTISFYNSADDSLICTDTDVPSGGTASCQWFDLDRGTTYNWYTIANDGIASSPKSDTWSFTVNYIPNKPTLISPAPSGITGVSLNPKLSVYASDPDGDDIYVVCFYNYLDGSQIGCNFNVLSDTITNVTWSGLSAGTTYSWYSVAGESFGSYNTSDTWSFTTCKIQGQSCSPNECCSGLSCCSGTCVNTSTDPNNCGSCGNSCGVGYNCVDGTCVNTNNPPTISSVTDSPDPVVTGNSITFSVTWSDSDDNGQKLLICKTNSLSGTSCSGGQWCSATISGGSGTDSCSYTTSDSDVGSNDYYAFVCDSLGSCSSGTYGSFTVENTPDNNPPDKPFNPSPENNGKASSTPVLAVNVTDPDSDRMDVTFYDNSGSDICYVPHVSSGGRAFCEWEGLSLGQVYSWYAVACDPDGECTQSNSWSFTTTSGSLPDLIIDNVWSVSNTIHYRISNIGSATANSVVTYLYVDGIFVDSDSVTSISSGNSIERTFSESWVCSDSSDELSLKADGLNTISESDEDNNWKNKTVSCSSVVPGCESIDISAQEFVTAKPGEENTIELTLENTNPDIYSVNVFVDNKLDYKDWDYSFENVNCDNLDEWTNIMSGMTFKDAKNVQIPVGGSCKIKFKFTPPEEIARGTMHTVDIRISNCAPV